MALLETSGAQERVDATHYNVYNMHSLGKAYECCDRASDTLECDM